MSIAESFADLLPSFLLPSDWQDIETVLTAAGEWAAGRLPIEAFAREGTIPVTPGGTGSPGYTRYCAVCLAKGDPRHGDLLRAIDELIRFQGYRMTNHGIFSSDDLHGMTIHYRRDAA